MWPMPSQFGWQCHRYQFLYISLEIILCMTFLFSSCNVVENAPNHQFCWKFVPLIGISLSCSTYNIPPMSPHDFRPLCVCARACVYMCSCCLHRHTSMYAIVILYDGDEVKNPKASMSTNWSWELGVGVHDFTWHSGQFETWTKMSDDFDNNNLIVKIVRIKVCNLWWFCSFSLFSVIFGWHLCMSELLPNKCLMLTKSMLSPQIQVLILYL